MHNYLDCLFCNYRVHFQTLNELISFSERKFAGNNPIDSQNPIAAELGSYPYHLDNKGLVFEYERIRLPLSPDYFELAQP
jgi:hypothetical protein